MGIIKQVLSGLWFVCNAVYVVTLKTKWNMSPFTGSQLTGDVAGTMIVRSMIECVYMCTSTASGCSSVQFNKGTKECTFLVLTYQGKGPYVKSNDVVHFSTMDATECPNGYHHLTTCNSCAKLFTWPGDYLSWYDSQTACANEGGALPILDTDSCFYEFQNYMDNIADAGNRVAVNARLISNVGRWGNGAAVDTTKYCVGIPDSGTTNNICFYMGHKSEGWCGSAINRLDDSTCDDIILRICTIDL